MHDTRTGRAAARRCQELAIDFTDVSLQQLIYNQVLSCSLTARDLVSTVMECVRDIKTRRAAARP